MTYLTLVYARGTQHGRDWHRRLFHALQTNSPLHIDGQDYAVQNIVDGEIMIERADPSDVSCAVLRPMVLDPRHDKPAPLDTLKAEETITPRARVI